ncbi:MAG: type II toxin-antitoxin system RelE/ParE family toxin [Bacteroidota bacterium]|nr:type II toxin-antitoxin system RelE/ParE family toxin [Bacteroidota bacterium]
MEKKIVVSKRFRKSTLQIYDYLIKERSQKIGISFLNNLQRRVELISRHPEIGKPSQLRPNVRSVTLQPHNRIYYRVKINTIELLCLFDMRKKKLPY